MKTIKISSLIFSFVLGAMLFGGIQLAVGGGDKTAKDPRLDCLAMEQRKLGTMHGQRGLRKVSSKPNYRGGEGGTVEVMPAESWRDIFSKCGINP